MEIPIQVAVQICPSSQSERCCVETIPNYIDGNVTNNNNNNNNNSTAMGLVRISRSKSHANAASVDDLNGNVPENDPNPTTFPIQHALPYGCTQEFLYQKCIQPMILNFLEGSNFDFKLSEFQNVNFFHSFFI